MKKIRYFFEEVVNGVYSIHFMLCVLFLIFLFALERKKEQIKKRKEEYKYENEW